MSLRRVCESCPGSTWVAAEALKANTSLPQTSPVRNTCLEILTHSWIVSLPLDKCDYLQPCLLFVSVTFRASRPSPSLRCRLPQHPTFQNTPRTVTLAPFP